MPKSRRPWLVGLALVVGLWARPSAAQVGTAFTYQGRLTDGAIPANGPYDFLFRIFDAPTGGVEQGVSAALEDVPVSAGLFTVSLDLGGVFTGNRRYLEIRVRPGASTGTYTLLAGRQELTPGPHSQYAALGAWSGLIGVPAGFADNVDNDSGGDITQVTAGTGLTGGGTTGAVTVSASFGGTGTATTVSRSDHAHFGASWTGSSGGTGLTVQNTLTSGGGTGVEGYSAAPSGAGVVGSSTGLDGIGVAGNAGGINAIGVRGSGDGVNATGVRGLTNGTTGSAAGVYGATTSPFSSGATGVWGVQGPAAGSYAGYFSGRAHVNGTLSKSAGSFKIDHPLDPENKYLYHSFVESPEMLNVYSGNVVLDAAGEGEVTLPEWFEALNQDFRYQLTPVGGPAPGLHVARDIADNRFRIAGGPPGLRVSWQVSGVRHDPYAVKNRIPVEELKPEHERGVYLQPEAYGLPRERGLDHRRQPREPAAPAVPARAE